MQNPEKIQRKILRPDEAAEIYSLNVGSLANMRNHKKGPRYYKRDHKIFYKPSDIEAWLFENPVLTEDSLPGA